MFWKCNDEKVLSSFIKIFTHISLSNLKQVLRLLVTPNLQRVLLPNRIGLEEDQVMQQV